MYDAESKAYPLAVFKPANVFWLTGYHSASFAMRDDLVCVGVRRTTSARPLLVVPLMYRAMCAGLRADLYCYGQPYLEEGAERPNAATWQDALHELLSSSPAILTDRVEMLSPVLSGNAVDINQNLMSWRSIKTAGEIAALEHAALALESVLVEVAGKAPQLSSRALHREMVVALAVHEMIYVAGGFWYGADGANLTPPSERRLCAEDLLKWDVGVCWRGWWADTARTSLGVAASPRLQRMRAACINAQADVEAMLRPGAIPAELYALVVKRMQKNGFVYRNSHIGHGIGASLYETPFLTPANEAPLQEGMVFNVEVPVFEAETGSVSVEDTYVMTRTGCRRLTRFPRDVSFTG